MNDSRISRRSFVSGRVQGVYYRATAANKARELGIDGHARNLPDGRVEVLASGEPRAVEEFIRWLWVGPVTCKVTAVEVSPAPPPERPGFAIS